MQRTRTTVPDRIDKQVRVDARWKIIQEVNKYKMRFRVAPHVHPKLIGMKNIQWAVFIARRYKLVNNLTLQRAGYRGY